MSAVICSSNSSQNVHHSNVLLATDFSLVIIRITQVIASWHRNIFGTHPPMAPTQPVAMATMLAQIPDCTIEIRPSNSLRSYESWLNKLPNIDSSTEKNILPAADKWKLNSDSADKLTGRGVDPFGRFQ
jgi:hypothetical protein